MKYVTTLQLKLHLKDIPSLQMVARDVIGIYNRERERGREREREAKHILEGLQSVSYYGHMDFSTKFELYVTHVTLLMMLGSCIREF